MEDHIELPGLLLEQRKDHDQQHRSMWKSGYRCDDYTRRFDEILMNVDNKVRIVDDALLHDPTFLSSFKHTYQFFQTCRDNNVTVNEKKFVFCQREVDFAGFNLGWESYTPSAHITEAVSDFSMPSKPTITDIRAWFWLVNQLTPFFATSRTMLPFGELLQS